MAVQSPACILCQRLSQGSKQDLFVRGHYICQECEARIIVLSRDDPDYDHYKLGLKKLWYWPSA